MTSARKKTMIYVGYLDRTMTSVGCLDRTMTCVRCLDYVVAFFGLLSWVVTFVESTRLNHDCSLGFLDLICGLLTVMGSFM